MSNLLHDPWSEKLEAALAAYDVSLLRSIAGRLLRARNQWPVDELRQRLRDAVGNAPVIDRRLKELPPACRKLLAIIGLSRRPDWTVGGMLELLAALGHAEGLSPVQTLFEEGLLHPVNKPYSGRVKGFEFWSGNGSLAGLRLFAHPLISRRARQEDLELPLLPTVKPVHAEIREADGLEWPLRLAVAWQQVAEAPLKRTLQEDFFKRDWQRLQSDPLLASPFAEHLADLPDVGRLAIAWAHRVGLLQEQDNELHAAGFDESWRGGLPALVDELWRALPDVGAWDPESGWQVERAGGNPFLTIYPLVLALLARQPASAWLQPAEVAGWVAAEHPFWAGQGDTGWGQSLILGLFFQMKLVQAAPGPEGEWLVRISPLGRWLIGAERMPPESTLIPQTLLVQANFDVLAFRQGLTPGLIAQLSRFAHWKSLGAACQLALSAEHVYRGLESGLGLEEIRQLLQRHGTRPLPDNVADALRTWANKRERIVVYGDATVIEFASTADLDEATRRGLVEVKLNDRLGLVRDESALDFRHFRLTGTRDYGERPERCLTVAEDGLTLSVDNGRADLMLDSELARLAELVEQSPERRVYRLTRGKLLAAIDGGLPISEIDEWLTQRADEPLSSAARLLAAPADSIVLRAEPCLVLHTPTSTVADALLQLPAIRGLIRERLGPTALAISEPDLPRLREAIGAIQQRLGNEPPA